jgi:hypothetical protein
VSVCESTLWVKQEWIFWELVLTGCILQEDEGAILVDLPGCDKPVHEVGKLIPTSSIFEIFRHILLLLTIEVPKGV